MHSVVGLNPQVLVGAYLVEAGIHVILRVVYDPIVVGGADHHGLLQGDDQLKGSSFCLTDSQQIF